jgi:hypothetical protein
LPARGTAGLALAALAVACPMRLEGLRVFSTRKTALVPLAVAVFWTLPLCFDAPAWSPLTLNRALARAVTTYDVSLDQLRAVVDAVSIPVQAVGGLTLEQAVRTPEYGAPLVVLGAPLTIDADAFKTASGDIEASLRLICEKVHSYGDIPVGKKS